MTKDELIKKVEELERQIKELREKTSTIECPCCGEVLSVKATKCKNCGAYKKGDVWYDEWDEKIEKNE